MLKTSNLLFIPAIAATLLLFSCEKDYIENKVPVINAGSSQLVIANTDSVTLAGSATDEDGKVVAYLWSLVSGPADVLIAQPGSASTIASKFLNGTYVFQLMATDEKGATGVDTVTITLNRPTIQTLELQPANNPLEVQLLSWNGNHTYSGTPDIPLEAWTKDNYSHTVRALLKFDISAIPATATIQSASLYLYSYPDPPINGNLTNANFGTDNSFVIKQVTADWSLAAVSFTNSPATTNTNQVVVPTTTQSNLDLNLDIKPMIQSMVTGNANYGFYMKIQNEVTYNSRIFVSSFNTTYTAKRPKLVIVYKK